MLDALLYVSLAVILLLAAGRMIGLLIRVVVALLSSLVSLAGTVVVVGALVWVLAQLLKAIRISVLRIHRYIVSLLRISVLTTAYTHGIVHTSRISD